MMREIPKRDAWCEPIPDRQSLAVGRDDHAGSEFRSPKIDPTLSWQNKSFLARRSVPNIDDELLGSRGNPLAVRQQRAQVPHFLERAKCPSSAGLAKFDRMIS